MANSHPRNTTPAPGDARDVAPGLREVLWIWGLMGALVVAVTITYARFPVDEFYNVSRSGIEGGLSRALVLLNFPIAFVAIALMGFAVARLFRVRGALTSSGRWLVGTAAVAATLMCLVTAFVVQQSDLDAKAANLIPAAGVVIAIGLTILAVHRTGVGPAQPWSRSDTARLVVIALLSFAALPWILADLGVFVGDLPLIGNLFMSREVPAGHTLASVHLGHHHGFDGVLFAIVALLLSRQLGGLKSAIRRPLTVYVAFMFVYGVTNAAQDFWGEQLVKRGTATTEFPSMVMPKLTPAWGLVTLATVAVAAALFVMNRPHRGSTPEPELLATDDKQIAGPIQSMDVIEQT